MFLANQEEIINSIEKKISKGEKGFIISGVSGTGKSYLIKNISIKLTNEEQDKNNNTIFAGDDYCEDRDYYPFYKYFSTYERTIHNHKKIVKNIASKAGKAIPFAGDISEYLIEQFFSITQSTIEKCSLIFSKEEIDIIFKLKHMISNGNNIIFIDNLQWWDKKSLTFLCLLLKSCTTIEALSFINNAIFIINVTTNQVYNNSQLIERLLSTSRFEQFNLDIISKNNYLDVLRYFGLEHDIASRLVDVLYSISNGNLQITQNIAKYLNDIDIDELLENPSVLQNSCLEVLIDNKLRSFGAQGNLIEDVLKYASIIGKSFSFKELERMTSKNIYELNDLIENANKLYLVERETNSGMFVHEIIREIFHGKTKNEKYRYYGAFADCLKYIKPGDYKARLACYLKAGLVKEAEIVCVLEYIKKNRNKDFIDLDFRKQLEILVTDSIMQEYLTLISSAYKSYNEKKYNEAINLLNQIEDIYHKPLLAERDYLLSICLSKSLNKSLRYDSVSILEKYLDINEVDNEGEIWTRVLLALIIAYVHINKSIEARQIEKELIIYLSERAEFDVEAKDKINILRRKASAIHDSDHAAILTKKSVEYFGMLKGNEPWNPIEYFMALTNHVGNLIVCGAFEDAFNYSSEIIRQLKSSNNGLNPRIEIALNNYVLSAVLAKKIAVTDAIGFMDKIVIHSQTYADIVLLQINRSNLLAMNNKLNEANSLLEDIYKELHNSDSVELYYEFCINSNRMVVAHLLGQKEEALQILQLCNKVLPDIGDQQYFRKRNKLIEHLILSDIITDGSNWLNVLFEQYERPNYKPMWNFYGLGYLFTDMAFWSES